MCLYVYIWLCFFIPSIGKQTARTKSHHISARGRSQTYVNVPKKGYKSVQDGEPSKLAKKRYDYKQSMRETFDPMKT